MLSDIKQLDVIINSFFFQHNDESFRQSDMGTKLQLLDIKSVTVGGRFYCRVGNIVGTSSTSRGVTVTVEGLFN